MTIDWVLVGDPGNAPATASNCCASNCGSVADPYFISKFEVTNAQYAEFLNARAAADLLAEAFGMGCSPLAGALVREARLRAGLTQRALARRAGTSQSVVARVEQGRTDPGITTLSRLLAAAGFELRAELTPTAIAETHMLDDVARILALTPEQRLLEVRNVSRFEAAARRA